MLRKQTKSITIRMTEDEYNILKERVSKSGMKQADFLRRSLFCKNIVSINGADKIIIELKRIGNNVNQIAKKLNIGGSLYQNELADLTEELKNIWQLLRQSVQGQV